MATRAELLSKLLNLQKKRQQQAFVDVKNIYRLGFPIEQYVPNTITADQYQAITGQPYGGATSSLTADGAVAPTASASGSVAISSAI